MSNKLALVGISGLLISAVCLGAAAAVGGKALRNGFDFDIGNWDKPRCDFDASGKSGSRSLAWNDGDEVDIQLPANVHYRRGSGEQMVITGDSAVLPHVRVRNGNVRLDCRGRRGDRLEITLPGRFFRSFGLAGTGSLSLDDIDQPTLKISLAGSGDVEATGKTDNLDVNMAGAGDAKLGALAAGRIKLRMAGSNDAEVAAKDDLNVDLAGSGKVTLRTEPRAIETHIAGSGRIIHPDLDKGI